MSLPKSLEISACPFWAILQDFNGNQSWLTTDPSTGASPEEMISHLQIARDDLGLKKREMERKIAGFHEKRRLKEIEAQKLKDHQQQQPR
jgi:hypothetical protein